MTAPVALIDAEPVLGHVLLERLVELFDSYLVLPKGGAEVLALYTIFTYLFNEFDICPLLVVTAPTKRCGKTRTQDVLSGVVRNPVRASNASAASLFRLIEHGQVTLLLDEYDTYLNRNEDIKGIVNGGHTRGSAYVLRAERSGEDFLPRRFSTWCPKILAGVDRLPPTIEDRSIILPMRRKEKSQTVRKLRLAKFPDETAALRSMLERWAADNAERVAATTPPPIEGFDDRASDNWEPLLAIGDVIGHGWAERSRWAARTLVDAASTHDEQDLQILLLKDLQELLKDNLEGEIRTELLLERLLERDERPWGESEAGKPINAHRLARRLKAFGISPRKYRNGTGTFRGYLVADFDDVWRRYL